jgi:SAM-dependent methyltransferase
MALALLPNPELRRALRRHRSLALAAASIGMTAAHKVALNRVAMALNRSRRPRLLEIGPGSERIMGFETMNISWTSATDYVYDAAKALPFKDNTFDLIYASHVLEHIPWYQTAQTLSEWRRILKDDGALEIWVPDGLKICRAFVAAEDEGSPEFQRDGWYRFNEERDPATWAAGRIFSYGDGTGARGHSNWHHALFSERRLRQLLERVGYKHVRLLSSTDVRGYDHGWINLGLRAEC